MKKKFIIKDMLSGRNFTGSGFEGAYFSGEEKPMCFNNEADAEYSLRNESELFPKQFEGLTLAIVPVYTFNSLYELA
jgi:hypothetical protein